MAPLRSSQIAASASTPASALAGRPVKSLLQRPALAGTIRKADDAGLDSDPECQPATYKRLKVSFDDVPQERVIEEYTVKGRSLESVRVEVRKALEFHAKGNSERYDSIKEVFAPNGEDRDSDDGASTENEMKTYLIALTSYVALLNRGCAGLVKTILACEWMGRDEEFVKAYVNFLGNLASAQGAYVAMVLGMLAGHLQGSMLRPLMTIHALTYPQVNFRLGRLLDCPDVSRDQLASRVHVALRYLLRLIPSASAVLSPILSAKFPFLEETKKAHITYIDNLIKITEYAPELKSDILALITDRLVKIDVQMQTNLDDLDDDVADAINLASAVEEDDDLDEDSDSDDDSVTSVDNDCGAKKMKEIRENVVKLDAIIDMLFKFYAPCFEDPYKSEAVTTFDTLMSHFIGIILPTYKSRHTQFLLFHFAQKSEVFADRFTGTCVQIAFEAGRPAILCQASVAYLASFVARGAHVQRHIVREVFHVLGDNLDKIRGANELACKGPDLSRYGMYYAMIQALLYIFCFRWRDLLESDIDDEDPEALLSQDFEWAPGIKDTLYRNIHSKLNPLKICSPSIVSEFAKIAQHLRFMYVFSLLEANKVIRLSQFASGNGDNALRNAGNGGEKWHQMESYFPFDPYQLPISKRWVGEDYIEYQNVVPKKHEHDDEDSADEDVDAEDDVEDDTATDEEAED